HVDCAAMRTLFVTILVLTLHGSTAQDDCKTTSKGLEYEGQISVTRHDQTCQRWDVETPHRPSNFEEVSKMKHNYCRNPDGDDSPWCYTMDPDDTWSYCDIPFCKECKTTSKGLEYRGTTSITRSNLACQRWDVETPHRPTNFEELSKMKHNYCRNPDHEPGPWCYTMDPRYRWDFCDIPFCESTIFIKVCTWKLPRSLFDNSHFYNEHDNKCHPHSNQRQSLTCSLLTWNRHIRKYSFAMSVREQLKIHINTTFVVIQAIRPDLGVIQPTQMTVRIIALCPFVSSIKDYIVNLILLIVQPLENESMPPHHGVTSTFDSLKAGQFSRMFFLTEDLEVTKILVRQLCHPLGSYQDPCSTTMSSTRIRYQSKVTISSDECKRTVKGTEYRGAMSVTESGKTCQRWDSNTPHHPSDYEFVDTYKHNFCRNPGDKARPWCYTTDPDDQKESIGSYQDPCSTTVSSCFSPLICALSVCDCEPAHFYNEHDNRCHPRDECKRTDKGTEYRGAISVTDEGRTCQRWDSTTPHSPTNYALVDTFKHNFCRNPTDSGKDRPWCYTIDPDKRWEYCTIPYCLECKMTAKGFEYLGTISVTRANVSCQRWDVQTPHRPRNFTDVSKYQHNYCRNPVVDKDSGPWCYTMDPDDKWDLCDIPFCAQKNNICKADLSKPSYQSYQSQVIKDVSMFVYLIIFFIDFVLRK
ncbi:plasminogen, partial [Mytilus galloprovincialis]